MPQIVKPSINSDEFWVDSSSDIQKSATRVKRLGTRFESAWRHYSTELLRQHSSYNWENCLLVFQNIWTIISDGVQILRHNRRRIETVSGYSTMIKLIGTLSLFFCFWKCLLTHILLSGAGGLCQPLLRWQLQVYRLNPSGAPHRQSGEGTRVRVEELYFMSIWELCLVCLSFSFHHNDSRLLDLNLRPQSLRGKRLTTEEKNAYIM